MRRRHLLSALLCTGLAACSTVASNGAGLDDIDHTGRSSDVITEGEMNTAGVTNAFQAISRLRPFFFKRGREMSAVVPNQSLLQVYLDDIKLGGLETLQTIPTESIKTIRYLSSSEATIRWGTNHTGGVILLSTR